eukprot:TRINITY_DN5623_c0_g1_i1.p1 TRINITY_DN5623_c0_g1~~TRINITY_DN5623_c0_g1_i1.p1  ORF type:complete len:138 (-),score=3.77 TRINITY_DN5623_c0_g1_i1:165-533(-)
MKSYARTPRHLLTNHLKVLNYFKKSSVRVKIFSDKNNFTLGAVFNRRNDRCFAKSLDHVEGTYRTKLPQQIMMLGVVSSDGKKTPPYFFKPGEKVDTAVYYKVLMWTVLPWLRTTYPDGNYT